GVWWFPAPARVSDSCRASWQVCSWSRDVDEGASGHDRCSRRLGMRRLVPVIVLALIAGAYYGYKRYLSHRPFEWAGTVEARTVTVGSRTGGRVKEVKVKEGDRVKPGDILIVLEPGDLQAQHAMALAQQEQAQAALDKLEKGARPEEIAQ